VTAPTFAPIDPLSPAPLPPAPTPTPAARPERLGRHPVVRTVALVLGGLLSVWAIGFGTFLAANMLVRTEENETRVIEGRVDRVVVSVTGSVLIEAGPADRSEIDRSTEFGFSRPGVIQRLRAGVLTVEIDCDDAGLICNSRVELVVPSDVDVEVSAERVEIADITGDIDLDTNSGSVELTRVSGAVDARVGGGSVIGRDLTSEVVRAQAGAGSVELQFTRPPRDVDVTAGAGSVQVLVPPGPETYRVDAQAGAGDAKVQVDTDRGSDRTIRAQAGAGDVKVRYTAG